MDFETIKKRLTEKLQKIDKEILRQEIEELNDFFADGCNAITVSQLKDFQDKNIGKEMFLLSNQKKSR